MRPFLNAIYDHCLSPLYTHIFNPYIINPSARLALGVGRAFYDPYRLALASERTGFILHTLAERSLTEGWSRASIPFSNLAVMFIADQALADEVFRAVDKLEGARSPYYDAFQAMAGPLPFVLSSSGPVGLQERSMIKHFMFPSDSSHNSAGERLRIIYELLFKKIDEAMSVESERLDSAYAPCNLDLVIRSAIVEMGVEMAYGPCNILPSATSNLVEIAKRLDKAVKLTPSDPKFACAKKAVGLYAKAFIDLNIDNLLKHDTYARKKALQYLSMQKSVEISEDDIFEHVTLDEVYDAFYKTNALMSLQALANISDIIITAYIEILKQKSSTPETTDLSALGAPGIAFSKSDIDFRTVKLSDFPEQMSLYEESLRYNVQVPNIARTCTKDMVVQGVTIRKGTTIVLPAYKLAHDANVYPDPEQFKPTRFNTAVSDEIPPSFTFSAGDRKCPASLEMAPRLFLAAISALCKYDVELLNQPEIQLNDKLYGSYPDEIYCRVQKVSIAQEENLAPRAEWLRQRRTGAAVAQDTVETQPNSTFGSKISAFNKI